MNFGPYKCRENIAEGGFGEVWKAKRDDISNVFFSIKVFKNTRDPQQLKEEM